MNKTIVGKAALLALLIALVGSVTAFAQGTVDLQQAGLSQSDDPTPDPSGDFRPRSERGHYIQPAAIAEALGISVEELEDARTEGKTIFELAEELGFDLDDIRATMQATLEKAVQQAVEKGLVSEDQAENMLSHIAQWALRSRRSEGLPAECDCNGDRSVVADALGITVEEFEAARAEGKTLVDLAEELGVDIDQVFSSLPTGRSRSNQGRRGKHPFPRLNLQTLQ
jgi:uncharacterized protein YidB (DUF937 family)